MTADQTPLSPEPGPDAGIDDIQADIEHTRKEQAGRWKPCRPRPTSKVG